MGIKKATNLIPPFPPGQVLLPMDNLALLFSSVSNNRTAIVRTLLEGGVDPDARDPEGLTPIHIASRSGLLEMTRLLAQAGADVDAKATRDGTAPLHWAAFEGKKGN